MSYLGDMELQFRFLLVDMPNSMGIGGYDLSEMLNGLLGVCDYHFYLIFLLTLFW